MGSGCGTVGRVVVSKNTGSGFESNHQLDEEQQFAVKWRKDKNEEKKRPGIAHLKSIGICE